MTREQQAARPAFGFDGVSKRFGVVQALSGMSFSIYPGEVLALVGENGAGKSTLMRSILDNIALCVPDRVSRFGLFDRRKAEAVMQEAARGLAIKAPGSHTLVSSLSGGNQQKVVLARWLARRPKVLILDEPTRGIDVGAKAEIYDVIDRLARQGMGLIVISSEMPELIGLADRLLVLSGGVITRELGPDEMTEDSILAAAMPLAAHAGPMTVGEATVA